ncbi:MAG: DEAD/DEAH box helicase [gamma proteobacterium symbiont of Taylorina sp.]|nr:DEAD/DEAH box helicase [gamma proteobacterium symbiont of Taylorina sp.]
MKITIDSQITIYDVTDGQRTKIIADNTYPNPEYQQALNMGRRAWDIDKNIITYKAWDDSMIIVPRGYFHLLPDCEITDNRTIVGADIPALNDIDLRDYQDKAVSDAEIHDQGIIQSGTGSGKSYMGMELIHRKQQRALILTHSKELMMQWKTDIKARLNIDCGLICGGKETQAEITIAMLQTLNKRPELLKELSENYGLVLIDECHHIPSKTFSKVINQLACKYRYGLTATPHRRDGLHQIINRNIGDIVAKVSDEQVNAVGGVVPVIIKQINTNRQYFADSWQEYISALVDDEERNQLIITMAKKAAQKTSTLILTDRVNHAEKLSKLANIDHLLIHGQLPAKERKQRMEAIPEHQLTIGTTGLLGEGLDVSGWTSLILSTPISSKVKLLQAVGRICRTHDGKTAGYVADLVDECGFSISSYRKRLAIYQEKQFKVIEA